ncbi:MAG: hypothetical protein AAF557_27315 [Pseudomonadota bacterium]
MIFAKRRIMFVIATEIVVAGGVWAGAFADSSDFFGSIDLGGSSDPHFSEEADDLSGLSTVPTLSLPGPFNFTRSYSNGTWQVDGVGFSPSTDVEIRATGRVNSETSRLQGDLTLRFRF